MDLGTSLAFLPGIGSYYKAKLARVGVLTVSDLINYYPFRYDDFSKSAKISEIRSGEVVTIRGEIWSIKNAYTRARKVITTAILNDGSNSIELIWFHSPYLTKSIHPQDLLQVSGKATRRKDKITIVMPQWEKVNRQETGEDLNINKSVHTGILVPVYSETEGLSSKWLRQKITSVLTQVNSQISDPMPSEYRAKMLDLPYALSQIHFPDSWNLADQARERLAFDELFYIQLQNQKRTLEWKKKKLINPLVVSEADLENFIKKLPFKLTTAQNKVIDQIVRDLKNSQPMNRLVQGDVGSGKTVVAAVIIYLVAQNNLGSVVMAPTELLAFQHFNTLTKLLSPFGINIGIYTGSRKKIEVSSKPDVIVGTHALLSDKLKLDRIGLVVVDEQQKFGVEQRSVLRQKTSSPHFLTMTATPIPRTVALTLYGDLDLSVIDELPPGRIKIKTHFVPKKKRSDAYAFIAKQIRQGRQVYIITPLIEEPALPAGRSETNASAKSAKVEFEKLKNGVFKDFKLGLLHGRLKGTEKESVLKAFKNLEIDILVSTSVVEVGIDIPNATIMLIEGADRFGLAGLHQLRGRVGRGEHQSYALLFTESDEPQAINRVKNLEKIDDGLKLAELDLKIRGSGQIFGTLQSGRWELKIASFSDLPLIEKTKEAAGKILQESPNLDKYPLLLGKLRDLEKIVMPD
ncbi:MAG: ATP-dependent DNA helicase RecG [Candidatus Daviesbacteria bacterium]|nr:ATP-dependent DNA helicase RecG [Candidatus Daviesbacteria bacterium]